jgi:uncharacterized protein YbaR (Trm112 family)
MGTTMISQQLLDILRCPLRPGDTRLRLADNALVCERCQLKFPIEKGFPRMLVEEAELPAGCASLRDLPCQREAATPASGGQP